MYCSLFVKYGIKTDQPVEPIFTLLLSSHLTNAALAAASLDKTRSSLRYDKELFEFKHVASSLPSGDLG